MYSAIEREKTFRPIHKYFLEKGGELDALKNILEKEGVWGNVVFQRTTYNTIENLEKDRCFFAKDLLPIF